MPARPMNFRGEDSPAASLPKRSHFWAISSNQPTLRSTRRKLLMLTLFPCCFSFKNFRPALACTACFVISSCHQVSQPKRIGLSIDAMQQLIAKPIGGEFRDHVLIFSRSFRFSVLRSGLNLPKKDDDDVLLSGSSILVSVSIVYGCYCAMNSHPITTDGYF